MTHQTKTEIIRHFHKAYERAGKAEKTRILATTIESTGYSRKHAIVLLRGQACAQAQAGALATLTLRSPLQASQTHLDRIDLPVWQKAQALPACTSCKP